MSTTETHIESTEEPDNSVAMAQTAGPPVATEGKREAGVQTDTDEQLCPECQGHLVEDGYETVCDSCGLIVDEYRIDHGPEWFADDETNEPNRGVAPVDRTHHDNGLGTGGYQPFDATTLSENRKAQLSNTSQQDKPRETGRVIGDIKRAGSALDLPESTIDNACVLFKKFHSDADHHGHNLDDMAAATLYGAARCSEVGLKHGAVAEQFDTDSQTLFEEVKRLSDHIDIGLPLSTPSMYVPQIVADLDGSTRTDTLAREIATRVEEDAELTAHGNDPLCVAAAVVYEAFVITTGEARPTQEEVGEVADVSPPSIRKHWRTIRENELGGHTAEV